MTDKPLTGIEKARAARAEKQRLRREGKLPPLPSRKGKRAARKAAPAAMAEAPTLADLGLGAAPEAEIALDEILSNEEIEAIRRRAREEVAAERRKSRARMLLDAAKDEARREFGTMPADEAREREMQEMVPIRINLPRLRLANGRECAPDPIIIDQRVFVHNWNGMVPRHQYEYLMDLMNRAWMHVAQVDGRTRTYYNEQLGTMVYQGGQALGGGSLGPGFDALHKRPA